MSFWTSWSEWSTCSENLGKVHVFRLLNVLMAKGRKINLVIHTNAKASINSMPVKDVKRLNGDSFSNVM